MAFCAAACGGTVRADTWTNSAGNGLWDDPLNWADGTVPTSVDDVDLPAIIPGSPLITVPDGAAAHQITFSNGYTLDGGTLELGQPTFSNGNLYYFNSAGPVATINTQLIGSKGLNISPQAPIALTGNNNFTGPINLSGSGTAGVRITSDSSLGNLSNIVTMYGQVEADATFTSHRNYRLGTSYAGFSVTSGHVFTIATPLNYNSVFTKYGTGTLALTQAAISGYSGGGSVPGGIDVDINAGVVRVEHGEALGTTHYNGVEVHQLGTLEVADTALARNVTLNGGTLRGKGNAVVNGGVHMTASPSSLSGGLLPTDSLTIGDGPNHLTSPFTPQQVNVNGLGRVILPYANSANLAWTVGGKLIVKHSDALGAHPFVTVGGGTLAVGGATVSKNIVITANGATFASAGAAGEIAGTIRFNGPAPTTKIQLTGPSETTSADLTFSGWWAGPGKMDITNTASQPAAAVFTYANTFTGPATVRSGAELASKPASKTGHALGGLAVTLDGGTLGFYSNSDVSFAPMINVGFVPIPLTLPSLPGRLKFDRSDSTGANNTLDAKVTVFTGNVLHTQAGSDYTIRLSSVNNGGQIIHEAGTLQLIGSQTYQPDSQLIVNGGRVVIDAELGGAGGNLAVDANAGETLINQTQHLAALDIAAGASVRIGGDGARVLHTRALNVEGVLDMADNELAVNYSGGPSPEDAIRALVKAAREGAAVGIFAEPGELEDNLVLAIADNLEWNQATLNDVPIAPETVVGKYTYFGDANLDGQVTSDDYVAIDVGLGVGDGWLNGDFDMDGAVTSDDYVAIDVNLGEGTSNPAALAELKAEMIALHAAMFGEEYLAKVAAAEKYGFAAVPEPAGAVSSVLFTCGLLARRRDARS